MEGWHATKTSGNRRPRKGNKKINTYDDNDYNEKPQNTIGGNSKKTSSEQRKTTAYSFSIPGQCTVIFRATGAYARQIRNHSLSSLAPCYITTRTRTVSIKLRSRNDISIFAELRMPIGQVFGTFRPWKSVDVSAV